MSIPLGRILFHTPVQSVAVMHLQIGLPTANKHQGIRYSSVHLAVVDAQGQCAQRFADVPKTADGLCIAAHRNSQ